MLLEKGVAPPDPVTRKPRVPRAPPPGLDRHFYRLLTTIGAMTGNVCTTQFSRVQTFAQILDGTYPNFAPIPLGISCAAPAGSSYAIWSLAVNKIL